MADPLRRTLLAKLRGKKSRKGATVGGGYGSSAAAAAVNGGREGKEKVLQTQRDSDEARSIVLFADLDCMPERMSTYENYIDGAVVPMTDGERAETVELTQPGQEKGQAGDSNSAQETDRLRNQLKEAYYLLINAMNDINMDVQQIGGLTEQQATSSCSREDQSPQQVSDTDSLLLCLTGIVEVGLKGRLKSKSMANLSFTKKPTLSRSTSDGEIRYQDTFSEKAERGEGGTGAGELSESQVLCSAISNEELLQDDGVEEERGGKLNESSGSINSITSSSDSNTETATHQGHDNKQELTELQAQVANSANKGHGVTVNKMQEWMHKGRMLSSEMKQRIEGSSLPRGGDKSQDRSCPQVNPGGCKPGTQTSTFIENVQTSCANSREAGRTNESSSWRPQLTTITVSKKRNWLQQSSLGKNQCTKDELQGMLGADEEGSQGFHQPLPSPSPSPDHLRPSRGAPPRPVLSPHPHSMDPAEENDADDEGEIWYNPIPEEDEQNNSDQRSRGLTAPPRAEPQRGSRDASQGNAVHSTEVLHAHRQMLACKPQEEGGPSSSRPTDCLDLPNTASFSPPSSPNPAKKSSSINWSFPDKIKSPRTVRKISMKMKKLPELSRKLSVKGTQNNSSSNGSSQLEPRAHSPKANGSGSEVVLQTSGPPRLASSGVGQASRNVISRYHLDSSVSTQHSFYKKKSSGSSKSASKGGYLSDGDSPELVAKSGKHGSGEGKGGKGKDTEGGGGNSRINGTELDIDAFRHYSFSEQPKCSQYISGLMSLHFYGAEDLKPPRIDSRDVYCAIQVDSVNKARTALLTCRTTFLDMDHTFNIELENAQQLKLVVFSWEPTPRRNRVCCHGTVVLPALFRVTRSHLLAVKLEPRGVIYVKLSLMEQWQNSLNGGPDGDREPQVFGVEVWRVVERENTGLMVPLLISKCINEIEKRGCQVVGLYRLCGSAAVKKELREAFERDSHAVELCENTYPDINVITGVLKDYLRELPYPLINKQLYEAVLESMAARPLRMGVSGCENDQADSEHTVSLLENLPEVERMMLRKLLDHLKLVASYQEMNKMTCQNLAVCFGPVLLSQRQEASCHTNRVFIDSEELASALHFKKHIEVLHYLLQLWPGDCDLCLFCFSSPPPLRRRKERPQVLNLTGAEMAGVLRPKPGRLDSPSNRYAGDWSGCGETYFPSEMLLPSSKEEADYDDVPSEDIEATEEVQEKQEEAKDGIQLKVDCPVSDTADEEVNLRDLQESIDTLIGNLERELNKNKLNVGY
uniref:Synapse defective Rho GTPase homolog 2 n=1 Tax=Neolamprologus brichardi TaxID=32507 RepID=A0A3Q4HSH3_NEOBR